MSEDILFQNKDAWHGWLQGHHKTSVGLWLRLAKKDADKKSISYAEAIEVALCWGWIDGQKKPLNEFFWLQKFTPRRPKSVWSKLNCEKIAVLMEQGAMQPSGMAEVDRAKADGRWNNAYAGSRTIQIPIDLQEAFNAAPKASAFFKTLNSQNRYSILFGVTTAVRLETRARRIAKFIVKLEKGEKPHT